MNIISGNSPNFQGRLNLADVKTNNTRWKNVAKCFLEKSKQFSNAEIKVCEIKHEMALEACLNKNSGKNVDIVAAFFTKTMDKLFAEKSDSEIADVLVRLLHLGDFAKNETLIVKNFANTVASKINDAKQAKKTFDVIYGEVSPIIKNEVSDMAKSDSAMENWAVILK